MKRQIPLVIIFVCGAFMFFQAFVPTETSEFFYEFVALDWPPIIGIFALTLGIISLVRVSYGKIKTKHEDAPYAMVTLAGLAVMTLTGLIGGVEGTAFKWQFNNVMIPISATMFSLLAFYIASAAYRAFRARSLLATVLLVAAVIVMIRFFPMGPLTDITQRSAQWILDVPNLAAKRAIVIGVGFGIVSTALKIILGIERSYLGKD